LHHGIPGGIYFANQFTENIILEKILENINVNPGVA